MAQQQSRELGIYMSLKNQDFWLKEQLLRDKANGIAIDPFNPVPSACKIFFPFRRLPIELRVQIWRIHATQSRPRVITMQLQDVPRAKHIISTSLVPSMLHVDAEARYIGLKYYQPFNPNNNASENLTYIHWSRDIIFARTWRVVDAALTQNPSIIQNCVNVAFGMDVIHGNQLQRIMLEMLSKLESVFAIDYDQSAGYGNKFLLAASDIARTRNLPALNAKVDGVSRVKRAEVLSLCADRYRVKSEKEKMMEQEEKEKVDHFAEGVSLLSSIRLPEMLVQIDRWLGLV